MMYNNHFLERKRIIECENRSTDGKKGTSQSQKDRREIAKAIDAHHEAIKLAAILRAYS